MVRKSIISFEEKLKVVQTILSQQDSLNHQAKILGIHKSSIQRWILKYKTFGVNGLKTLNTNRKYSKLLKLAAVKEYLSGGQSLFNICKKYQIYSQSQIMYWISLYNNARILKSGGFNTMKIKGTRKKISLEDRIEVIKYYLENNKNYAETAIKFQVSYQQVYQWVQKFNKGGVDALIDRRGKRKPIEEMSEVDKLKLENEILKAKYRRIELENALLKKLNELEGV